ncbi:MAG: hypothetical protein ABI378_03670 [Chitinophagaceae bacterium]
MLKNILLTIVLFSVAFGAAAQGETPPIYAYLTGGAGAGTIMNYQIEAHLLFLKHHGLTVGYQGFMRDAPATPSDYSVSTFLNFNLNYSDKPQEYLNGWTFSYSYFFYPKGKAANLLRYPLSLGLLTGTYSEPGNFNRTSGWGNNYAYDDLAEHATVLQLKAGLEFVPTRAFGLGTGIYATIGKLSGLGIYGNMLLGYVGDHRRAKNRKHS